MHSSIRRLTTNFDDPCIAVCFSMRPTTSSHLSSLHEEQKRSTTKALLSHCHTDRVFLSPGTTRGTVGSAPRTPVRLHCMTETLKTALKCACSQQSSVTGVMAACPCPSYGGGFHGTAWWLITFGDH